MSDLVGNHEKCFSLDVTQISLNKNGADQIQLEAQADLRLCCSNEENVFFYIHVHSYIICVNSGGGGVSASLLLTCLLFKSSIHVHGW